MMFKPHWIMLAKPLLIAFAGVVMLRIFREGLQDYSRFIYDAFLRAGLGYENISAALAAVQLGIVALIFWPLIKARAVRATWRFELCDEQIVWRHGVFNRYVEEIEIAEIVGVNLFESITGRIFGFSTVLIDTRGRDTLVMPMIGGGRTFANQALEAKRRLRRTVGNFPA
jgi:uncharacterized membrane protein YdbT with pleckstrin-like domain